MNIYREIVKAQEEKKDFALVTIVKAEGSTPRGEDAKMIVLYTGESIGTIGGGELEAKVMKDAKSAIEKGTSILKEYKLDDCKPESLAMKCGGDIQVFIEVHKPQPRLVIIGAGHVGKALSDIASLLDFNIIVVDDRAEWANIERFPKASDILVSENISEILEEMVIGQDSYVVIATRGHEYDKDALGLVIKKKAKYIGMIGSRNKVKSVFDQLQEEGYSKEELKDVYSPIGLDLGGETPEEIAISILAEIMKIRYSRDGSSLSSRRDCL